jgi:carbamoyl-phosphate synthase large subunit
MKDREICVGITGLNATDSPGPGVGVIRCLHEAEDIRFRIIGLAYETLEPGIYMHDLVHKSYQIPYPSAGMEQLYKRLAFIQEHEKMDLIIPNFDAELWNMIRLAPRLNRIGIRLFLPDQEQIDRISKVNLFDFAVSNGIRTPESKMINSMEELDRLTEEIEYPIVIKGRFYEAFITYNKDQLVYYYHKLNARWGLPVILQEFIDGSEIVIAGLGDGAGNTLGAVPLRKLYITDKGKGWAGVVIEDAEYLEIASKFNASTLWKGGFEIELKRDDEGKLFLLEINPRFPAWIYTTAAAGQNLPLMMVRMAFGETVEPLTSYETGKMFVRYSWDLITDIQEFRQISTLGEL